MNHIQFALLLFFGGAAFISGVAIYIYINAQKSAIASNRAIYLGETLLLGSTVIYGLFMLLSLVHLYMRNFLFAAVAINYLWLFRKEVRMEIGRFFKKPLPSSASFYVLILFLGFFIFRNYFFMVDIDSHSSYLNAQKIWLSHKTSIVASPGIDIRVFTPHFEDVLGALGISFYPKELLYSQLINIFFRVIVILLVYGYTTFRFQSLYGLAASFFIMFNLHFFVSGANMWVLINGALVALIFATAYNFFESYRKSDNSRFFIALLFLTQFPSNKYQSLYVFIVAIVLGFWIQPSLLKIFKTILKDKRKVIALAIFIFISLLIFIKNWLATGWPFFPMFSGYFNILDRDLQMEQVFAQIIRGTTPRQFLKYVGFLFIWHGMRPAHWFYLSFCFLPVIFLGITLKKNIPAEKIKEFPYWMAASFFGMAAICLINHTDPRQYVFVIGILTFSAIFIWDFILVHFLQLGKRFKILVQIIILFAGVQGANIFISMIGGGFKLPTLKENWKVITNKLHTADIISRYYRHTNTINAFFESHPEIINKAAYYFHITTGQYSFYLVPECPSIAIYVTSIVRWKSYENPNLILEDLRRHDIEHIVTIKDDKVVLLSPEEFAQKAVETDRFPKQTLQEYGFPYELKYTDYSKIKKK